MRLKALFIVSAAYMALLGLGFALAPQLVGIGAVPALPSAALIAYLRVFGSTFIAIGVLNWMARDATPSVALRAIVVANIVGFGLAGLLDAWGVISGARPLALVLAVVHLLFAAAFVWVGRSTLSVDAE